MKKHMLIIVVAGLLTAGSVALASDLDVQPIDSVQEITIQQAKEIALQEVDGNITSAERGTDNGKAYYEIDIDDGTSIYEFEIDATTGEISELEKEVNQRNDKKEANKRLPSEEIEKTKPATPSISFLSIDEAIAIAKEHTTGVVIKVGRDKDIFEIEMEDDKIEYELEIDGLTGEIISFEKDLD